MGAKTPGQAPYEDGLRAKLAEVTREHALLVRYLGPSATQAALSGLEPRDVVLDEAAQEPKPAPVGPGRAAWLKSVELWGPGHAATFDDLSDLERGQWSSIAQAGMDGSEYVRELERRATQEPQPDLGDWPAILADVTQQRDDLRELLDEVGVMAANAPEDDGSFAVCEQIAMRVAAADMPAEPVPGDVVVTPGDGTPIGGLLAHVGVEAHAAPELAEPVTVAGVLCRDYPSVVTAMQAEIDRRRVVFLRVEGERDQLREAHERQRLELLQAQGETAETSAELVRVKQLHAGLLGEVKPNGGGYTFRTTGVLLARRYAAANLPLRDDLSKLAGQ